MSTSLQERSRECTCTSLALRPSDMDDVQPIEIDILADSVHYALTIGILSYRIAQST